MTLIIVLFDVGEVYRVGDTGILIKLAGKSPKIGIVYQTFHVAFEIPT